MRTRKNDRLALPEKIHTTLPEKVVHTIGADDGTEVGDNNQVYAQALRKIVGLAQSGAMLGHDHAYDACRKIEALATEALPPTTNLSRRQGNSKR